MQDLGHSISSLSICIPPPMLKREHEGSLTDLFQVVSDFVNRIICFAFLGVYKPICSLVGLLIFLRGSKHASLVELPGCLPQLSYKLTHWTSLDERIRKEPLEVESGNESSPAAGARGLDRIPSTGTQVS